MHDARVDASASTESEPAGDAAVSAHLRCVTCQYDLFGSRLEGLCPECGTPVDVTRNAVSWMSSLEGRSRVRRVARIQLAGVVLLGLAVLAGIWTIASVPFLFRATITTGIEQCATLTVIAAVLIFTWLLVPRRVRLVLGTRLGPRGRWWQAGEVGASIGAIAFVALIWLMVAESNRWFGSFTPGPRVELILLVVILSPFALLGITSWRHLFAYEANAILLDDAGRPWLRTASRGMAWLRFSFELIWLAGCAAGSVVLWFVGDRLRMPALEDFADVLAMGGYIGCFAFMGVWALMLVYHVSVAIALRR